MSYLFKKRIKKAGLPPGTPFYIGERESQETRIRVIEYDEKQFQDNEIHDIDECKPNKEEHIRKWIDITGLKDTDKLEKLSECLDIHPLVLEDILNTNQRPKIDDYEDYLFIVLKIIYYDEDKDDILYEQVSIILGHNYVVSVRERQGKHFDPIKSRLSQNRGRIRRMGADYLAYSLIDVIVDNYFIVLEKLGDDIEGIQDSLITTPSPATLDAVYNMKRQMITIRKAVWPLREVIAKLEKREITVVKQPIKIYIRDLYDHTIQVIDTVESLRDILSGFIDLYLSSISNRMNEIMKVLTIISTIFIPITFIAGLYGMNFEFMPELGLTWSYPVILVLMLLIGLIMVFFFKKKKWL